MDVKVREDGGVHVVSVEGELTNLTAIAFFNAVVGLRTRPGTRIVLDLAAVAYLDSTGAGQVWRTVESTREEGGRTVLAAVPPNVRKVLDLIGFSGQVEILGTVEEAVRVLAAWTPTPHLAP